MEMKRTYVSRVINSDFIHTISITLKIIQKYRLPKIEVVLIGIFMETANKNTVAGTPTSFHIL